MRKGYLSEKSARKLLEKECSDPDSIAKVAISQFGADYVLYSDDSPDVKKVVEVKECHGKKYYPSKREKEQLERIKVWCNKRHITAELWIHYPNERRWDNKVI